MNETENNNTNLNNTDQQGNGQYYDPNQNIPNGQQYSGQYQNYGQNAPYNYGQNQNYGQNDPYNYGQNQNYGQNGPYNYGQNQNYGQYQNYEQNGPYSYGQNQNYGQNGPYNYGQNQNYGQYQNYGQQPFVNPQAAYQQAAPVQETVSNVFYYILMTLTAVSALITIIFSMSLINATFSADNLDVILSQNFYNVYSSLMDTYSASAGASVIYTLLTYALGFSILAFSIIDIVTVHKKGYPILGLILFTIFLKPGYFIWRAHVVKQKKTLPVVFTICYILAHVFYFFWCFTLVMRLMSGM